MFGIELPKCSCGRDRHPFMEGRFVIGLFGYGCAMLCTWCDYVAPGQIVWDTDEMWAELEMLERGSWPRRVADLIDDHQPHPNCRCVVFPQVDPPNQSD